MGEITDFVQLYIDQSDIIPNKLTEIETSLEENMRDNLWKGHGYDTGELYRDIQARSEVEGQIGIVTGWYTVEHGQYVISGVRGKGFAKSGPIDFLGLGLEKTLEAYR